MSELNSFEICSVKCGDRALTISPPFVFTPRLSLDYPPFLGIYEPGFGIYVYARTRERLQKNLEDQIFILWDQYVKKDDAILTKKSIKVAQILRDRIKEIETK